MPSPAPAEALASPMRCTVEPGRLGRLVDGDGASSEAWLDDRVLWTSVPPEAIAARLLAGEAVRYGAVLAATGIQPQAVEVTATPDPDGALATHAARDASAPGDDRFLLDLVVRLSSLATPEAVAQAAADALTARLGRPAGFGPVDEGVLVVAAADGRPERARRYPLDALGAPGDLLRAGRPALVPAGLRRGTWPATRGGLVVPVPGGAAPAGLVFAHGPGRAAWRPADAAWLIAAAPLVWQAYARARDDAERAAREAHQRTLLDTVDVGLCVVEMVYDADGRPVDYRIVEANPAFEQHTGLTDAVGRTVREMAPEIESFWIERYGRVAETGVAERFQAPSTALGREYDVYAFRVGRPEQRRVGIRFNDETARRQSEAALRRRERHQAFLVRLADALHPLDDPAGIQQTAAEMMGAYLGVHRAAFAEIEGTDAVVVGAYAEGVAPLPERFSLTAFSERMLSKYRRGEPVAVADVFADLQLTAADREVYQAAEVAAFTGVVLHRGGAWVALFGTHSKHPRAWTADELHLIDEVAARAWSAAERARADAARRVSDERYRLLEDSVPALVWMTDADGRPTYYNRTWLSYTGQTLDDALAPAGAAEVIHPDDIDGARAAWRLAAEAGGAFSYETRLRSAAGPYEWHAVRAAPLLDGGAVTGWIGTALNVHAHRQAQAALRESEARFRALASAMPQFVWTMETDAAGEPRMTYLNERWFEYTGQTPAEAYAAGISTVIHPRDVREVGARWEAALQAGSVFSSEMRLRDHACRYAWHLARAVPVRDEATGRVTWYGTSTDVHAQKMAEEDLARVNRTLEHRVARRTAQLEEAATLLQQSETRFRLLFEQAPIGIALARPDGLADAVNPALCKLLGYTEDELMARSWMSLTHPDDLGADLGLYQELVGGQRSHYEIEKRLRPADGRVLWACVAATAVRDPDGALAYTVVTVQDVTARRRYEMAALEASEAERRRLSYELHDDLGQRLASAAMMTSTLARQLAAEPHDRADIARRVGEILRDAIGHTRALSRGLAPVDLIHEGLAEALSRLCESTGEAYGLVCEMDLPGPMPVNSPSVAAHLFRIVQEAVSNAARHAGARSVRVSVREEGANLVLRVTDDGTGLPASALAEGGGLGMRAMRSRAAALGGALSFVARSPQGTSVVLELPRESHMTPV